MHLEIDMENPFPEIPADRAGLLTLGVALGENFAFGVVSGRTAAAQAACLQRLRDEKLFQALEPTWEGFCPKHLKISRAEADRTIRLWEEFGSAYFEMAQLTRISAETYRAIAPAVKDGALHVDGETIELNAENSRRVSAAVARLRREIPTRTVARKTREIEAGDSIDNLRGRTEDLLCDFLRIARSQRDGPSWTKVAGVAEFLSVEFARIAAGKI
jgi:hypothetical protein